MIPEGNKNKSDLFYELTLVGNCGRIPAGEKRRIQGLLSPEINLGWSFLCVLKIRRGWKQSG